MQTILNRYDRLENCGSYFIFSLASPSTIDVADIRELKELGSDFVPVSPFVRSRVTQGLTSALFALDKHDHGSKSKEVRYGNVSTVLDSVNACVPVVIVKTERHHDLISTSQKIIFKCC